MRNIGVSAMHQSECFAVGGFKINGPPRIGKGPMDSEEGQELNNEASLPQPTQAGRIETCTELISKAMKCLENNDKQCVIRLIEELIKNQCHDGRLIGKEVADNARNVIYRLWRITNDEARCEVLTLFKSLGVSRNWISVTLKVGGRLSDLLRRCGIEIEGRVTRNKIIENIESLMVRELSWSEK